MITSKKLSNAPRKPSLQIPNTNFETINRAEGTTTSAQKLKPQLKITRNNLGTVVFVVFGIFFDLVKSDSFILY